MVRNIIVIIALCCGLLACKSSPRKHYFVLNAVPPTEQQTDANNTAKNNSATNNLIGIGPIDIADYLDHSHIVYTENDNILTVSDNDYWAEPLDKGVARVIALSLAQFDPTRSFVNFPWRSDSKPQYSLRIHLHSLKRSRNQVSINATWELVDNHNKSNVIRKNFSQSTPVGSDSKAMVQGISKLLAELAEEMNRSLIAVH